MRIKRTNKTYRVNGLLIGGKALETIGREVFNPEGWQRVQRDLAQNGTVNITFNVPQKVADDWRDALNKANKKIAALEKKVAQLTIENTYLNA